MVLIFCFTTILLKGFKQVEIANDRSAHERVKENPAFLQVFKSLNLPLGLKQGIDLVH